MLLLAGVLPAILQAQTTAQITGSISDTSGASISGAVVTAHNVDTGIRRNTQSNDTGLYRIPLLPPGEYQVTVNKEGFRPVRRSGMRLRVEEVARVDFILEVGPLRKPCR